MQEYIFSYVAYILCLIVAYIFGKKTGIFKHFPVVSLLCIPTNSIMLMSSLAFCVIAAYMDKENDMEVYDIYHIAPIVCLIIGIIYKIINKQLDTMALHSIYTYIPLIFTILTVKTRGFADTLAMTVYALLGIYLEIDALYIILGYFIGYLIQFIIQCIYCKKEKIPFRDKPKRAFLPALYIGNSITISLVYLFL